MGASVRFLIIVLMALQASSAYAGNAAACIGQLRISGTIQRTTQQKFKMEAGSVGSIYQAADSAPALERGAYVYLITQARELLIAKKYGPGGLATHGALLKRYEENFGTSVEDRIVSAGELIVAFKEVTLLNNRSGNFRGSAETLNFSEAFLRAKGIPFAAQAQVIPFDPKNHMLFGHTPESREIDSFQLSIREELKADAQSAQIFELYQEFVDLVGEVFPSGGSKTGTQLLEAIIAGGEGMKAFEGLSTFTFPLNSISTVDGLEFGVWQTIKMLREGNDLMSTDDLRIAGYEKIQCLIRAKKNVMPKSLIQRLDTLSKKFAALKALLPN